MQGESNQDVPVALVIGTLGKFLVQQRNEGGVKAREGVEDISWSKWTHCSGTELQCSWYIAEKMPKIEERKRNQVRKY